MTENEAIERLECMRLFMQINDKASESKFIEEDYIANKMAIKALEEIQQYRAIGTVSECREALEKQRAKKPIKQHEEPTDEEAEELVELGFRGGDVLRCPNCNEYIVIKDLKHCMDCGQHLDWSDTP